MVISIFWQRIPQTAFLIRPYQSPLVVSLTNLTKPAMLICMSFFNTLSRRLRFGFGL
ncbi:hypothetical protein EC08BKT55439_2513 [Escherichia coli 08BKT055439]|nr:hypothetical protein ECFRIK1990_3062 [Escherichia coli FRIK1990]EIO36386.1 hypothetical protein ECPA41_3458 [Escherichia coli PA41]EKV78606.1 hypothetical protein EC881467_3551 [Escherichia coli 88.1467]ERC62150.1 hypothetical protein EC08BKT55439_2513 [Escherichia coli 08BKT055439]ERC83549.1 hypothetical protein B230_2905 [Escherichia coli 14A]ERE06326.1 hypothetical protein EC08BKT77219_2692 [Escherichia coli 08BKT77219]